MGMPVARPSAVVMVVVGREVIGGGVLEHGLNASQQIAQLVHALQRLLQLCVARVVQAPDRRVEFVTVERVAAVSGVLGQQFHRHGFDVAVVEVREQQF